MLALARSDLGAPLRLARESFALREPALLGLVAALVPLGVASWMVWCLRSWNWDPIWYHVPITSFAIQDHSVGWAATHNDRAAGFARGLELLSVWNVLLPRDSQLDDAAQLPFALLALLALAAWLRRIGASRPLAIGLGALWLLIPAVFLQLSSTHVDVACGALFIAAWVWLTEPRFGPAERWLSLLAFALYASIKFTGLFHLALAAPIIVFRAGGLVLEARRTGRLGRLTLEALALAGVVLWLSSPTYLHNLVAHHNPVWPIRTRVPWSGELLSGSIDRETEWTAPFFLTPGSLGEAVKSWYGPYPALWPDVRGGGWGPLFRWLGAPALALAALFAIGRPARREAFASLGLFVLAVLVPSAWWPRFVLGAPAAGLAALALLHGRLARAPLGGWLSRGLSLAAVAVAVAGFLQGFPGLGPLADPAVRARAASAAHVERATLQVIGWMWPEESSRLREAELREGDVVAYDTSVDFLAELWTHDLRNRIDLASHAWDDAGGRTPPSERDDVAYLTRLRELGAVWAAVRPGGRAEAILRAIGSVRLFVCGHSNAVMYRLPPQLRAARPAP